MTTYSESVDANGQRLRSIVYPDGGTRIELYYADGQLAKLTGTAVNPVRSQYGVEQDGGVWKQCTTEIKLDANWADTPEWTKTFTDMPGRNSKTVYAAGSTPYPCRESFYNNLGQLCKERDPDGVVTLYGYDARGQQVYTAIDINRNDQIDFAGTDRISWTTNDLVTYSGQTVKRTRKLVFAANGSTATALASATLTGISSLKSWDIVYRDSATPVVTCTETVHGQNGARTITTTAPDGSAIVKAFSYGRLISETRKDASGNVLWTTAYTYDPHGRLASATDSLNRTTTWSYNNADQILSVTSPAPGNGQPSQITLTFYDLLGRVSGTLLSDGSATTNLYYPNGLLKQTSGSAIYPVQYTYDAQGRIRTMKTWQDFAADSGWAVTRRVFFLLFFTNHSSIIGWSSLPFHL
ncbi:MAG: hypothetical protein QHJ82_04445 [Verrucomicrobiota bacterium]|nr:hypothetical protein [Verrucomicrobiota bacterium]